MSLTQHILIVVFWILFGLTHSLMASLWFKGKAEKVMGRYYSWYRPLYSVIALFQTTFILFYTFSIHSVRLWQFHSPVFIITALAGLVIMALSIRKYFFNLSGIQVLYKKQPAAMLETSGMHVYVRHPLYAGTLLLAWSIFFLYPVWSYLLTCVTMTAYTLIGIRYEERKLEVLYGQSYTRYKNNVPSIIPFTKFGKLSKAVSDKLS